MRDSPHHIEYVLLLSSVLRPKQPFSHLPFDRSFNSTASQADGKTADTTTNVAPVKSKIRGLSLQLDLHVFMS